MDSFHSLLKRRRQRECSGVLATLRSAEGHAYRKPGAAMLIGPNGQLDGHLSPGCIEADLARLADRVLESGRSAFMVYDVREADDLSWGEAVGCGGRLEVLLEPMDATLVAALDAVERALDEGHAVKLARRMNGEGLVSEYRVQYGDCWHERFSRPLDGMQRVDQVISFYYEANPRLLVFGAGDDAMPVVELASRAGFSVIVADRREALCSRLRFPSASLLVSDGVNEMGAALAIGPRDRAVVMTHQMAQDRDLLVLLAKSPVRFIGLLGSSKRVRRLTEGLLSPRDSRLHAPVGIVPFAEGPERIAISIVAELLEDIRQEGASISLRAAVEAEKG
ncbi:Xanthine dehydrogenase [Paenibacillus curdlanolyticus YK9]|uniref:Xanthine dehydrogenase n=1 Tax=Paenibacillus curdlanolyticus YK9 TaxID=717606 RepID=E0IDQ9_9BACL|nr:XdhC/CoxI family protein [Paenibacillus curdlanolyticus]EFM09263.1 Xanthine dehydrogenase [Paenibacillus curdlanolyticus YK9]